jgi:hypothetical protein
MTKTTYGSLLAIAGLLVLLGACGGGPNAGDTCTTKGEQTCSGNKEMSCGDDAKWKVDEDCGAAKKTCIIKNGDADCE